MAQGKKTVNWIQGAVKRPGAFSAKAKAAGESTAKFAQQKKNSKNPTLAHEAALAITLGKMRKKK